MNEVLKNYIPTAKAIVNLLGKNCEVVIHDLSQPESSVVFVINGEVTGRKVGQSFDHLVKQVLLNKDFKDDCSANYYYETESGKKIKSVSSMLRDINGDAVGMLCINYDITALKQVENILDNFLDKPTEIISSEPEQDVQTVINQIIFNVIGNNNSKDLSRKKCVEMIKFMDDKGIFLVKGAMEKVAELLGVSKVTIYSYLDEAKGKR